MKNMESICVFCGSSSGFDEIYAKNAVRLGQEMARRGIRLIYGGGNIGIMGLLAMTVMNAGGTVTGIIPEAIHKKVDSPEGVNTIVVENMHSRKQAMHDRSDGFIALPGGIGTLEELLETFTWSQLGFHQKPVAVLNTKSFYSSLILQLNHCVDQGFMKEAHKKTLIVENDPVLLLDRMNNYKPLSEDKWVK